MREETNMTENSVVYDVQMKLVMCQRILHT